jgi:hypothetical protein
MSFDISKMHGIFAVQGGSIMSLEPEKVFEDALQFIRNNGLGYMDFKIKGRHNGPLPEFFDAAIDGGFDPCTVFSCGEGYRELPNGTFLKWTPGKGFKLHDVAPITYKSKGEPSDG